MPIEETLGNLFKPEVKSSGRKLFAQEKVSISNQSDTAIQAYVRVSPPSKVKLTSDDISSVSFTVECSCPAAKKDRLCKHVWATLLAVEEKHPDFLSEKTEIENITSASAPAATAAPHPRAEQQKAYQEAAKERANEYRKDQYQKQKARLKEKKRQQKGLESAPAPSYSPEVEAAFAYFDQNGFPMSPPSKDAFIEAKRKLSRLFHPDKGGTHHESVELNQHCEVLQHFFKNE